MHIPGWVRGTDVNSKPITLLYDDIYFAVGPNAAARVEIGNNAVYEKCTKMSIATPITWSDTEVIATIREGSFRPNEDVYLFVVNAENVYSAGFGPFKFAGGEVVPKAPEGFTSDVPSN